MNNDKQSSVEWLLNQITYDNGYGQRRCSFIDTEDLTSYFEQAKAMHKEEIIHSYRCGAAEVGMIAVNKPKQYYKETFGGTNE